MSDSRLISEAVKEEARRLYVPGKFGYGRVSKQLGIPRGSVARIVSVKKAEQDRARSRAYKQRQRGVCIVCGVKTRYSGSRTAAGVYNRVGVRCRTCQQVSRLKWTQERVIEAIQEWVRRTGKPPSANEWRKYQTAADGYEFPPSSSVYGSGKYVAFAKWGDAIEAAGFPRPRTAYYERTPESRRKLSESHRRRRAA